MPRKLGSIPVGIVLLLLPIVKLFDRSTFDKLAFVLKVMAEDTIAPPYGKRRLEDYFLEKAKA